MRYLAIGLAALAVVACRTHAGDPCDPACTETERASFAQCVAAGMPAYGDDPACPAGNRMCCALNQHCLGELDDQTVTTDGVCPDLPIISIEYCAPPCDATHEEDFDECVDTNGFEMCFDEPVEACCAATIGCVGVVGGFQVVSTAPCCELDTDCMAGEICNDFTGECESESGRCGDFITDVGEECDAGPDGDELVPCEYGELSCLRCTASCFAVAGEVHYCGDETIDPEHEACDPPGPICTLSCQDLPRSACGDRVLNFDETSVDCGGPSCGPCNPGEACREDTDCQVLSTFCSFVPACDATTSQCIEVDGCDDGDVCTRDRCEAASGGFCVFEVIDDDFDDVGPGPLCGGDCDDMNESINPGNLSPTPCDTIDDDCDGDFDEGTACP